MRVEQPGYYPRGPVRIRSEPQYVKPAAPIPGRDIDMEFLKLTFAPLSRGTWIVSNLTSILNSMGRCPIIHAVLGAAVRKLNGEVKSLVEGGLRTPPISG